MAENNEDAGYQTDSSAPNSESFFEVDGLHPGIELNQLEDDEYTGYIPVIVHLAPPVFPDGPPIFEIWGSRPFGYKGETVIWTIYRAEPQSDDIPDDETFWAPLGIQLDNDAYYRAWVVRPRDGDLENPPATPEPLDIFYVKPENRIQPVPGALLIKTYLYHPENPQFSLENEYASMATFWLLGCGKVTDPKDLKRIRMKVDIYLGTIKGVACRHDTDE